MGCDDGADQFVQLGEDDIPQILSDLRKQKNGNKFISLFDEGEIPDKKTQSEADVSLCAMIAFRTGPDPDLINSIFRQSALYHPKWDREDYATRTIEAGIEACHGYFHPAVKKEPDLPPFVIMKKGKRHVSIPKLEAYVNTNLPYIIIRDYAGTDSNIYVYRNGVYNRYAREVFAGAIKAFIEAYDPNLVDVAVLDKTVASICKSEKYVNIEFLNTDEQYINLQNGLLDITSMKLLPHDPKVHSTVQLPLVYDPDNTATPVFDSYLDTLTDGVADKKQFLLEFLRACLSNVPRFHMKKALFLYGPGDTGKSILKRLTEKLLGVGNYTGIDISQMEARFGSSSIYGKRLSGSADMSFMTISELKIFNKATGGDVIRAEFKGKDGFEFTYKGLLWFCMNKLPKFGGDDGQWVYDRIIPVHCPNVIPVSKRDPELLDKMFQERDGIFNKAVRAFKTVIENDYTFHEPFEAIEMRKKYRIDNNTALEFFNTMMEKRTEEIGRNDASTIDAIYKSYVEWYFEQSYKSIYRKNRKEFFNDIADFLGEEYETMKKRVHSGVCLKDYVLKKNAPAPMV